jgi:hypothetical protein
MKGSVSRTWMAGLTTPVGLIPHAAMELPLEQADLPAQHYQLDVR